MQINCKDAIGAGRFEHHSDVGGRDGNSSLCLSVLIVCNHRQENRKRKLWTAYLTGVSKVWNDRLSQNCQVLNFADISNLPSQFWQKRGVNNGS
eukprot:753178-Hanusia_phi.AAC.6